MPQERKVNKTAMLQAEFGNFRLRDRDGSPIQSHPRLMTVDEQMALRTREKSAKKKT